MVMAAPARVVTDNLGCVFITGGARPPLAVGGKRFGEFVSSSGMR